MKGADKVTGLIILGVVGTALAVGLYYLLPFLIELAKNTIIFGLELVVLMTLAIVFLDKGTWTAIYYKWKTISRNLRKAIVREDPIGVLATVIARFATKLDKIDENITQAVGARHRQDNAILKAKACAAQEFDLAKAAKRMGKPDVEVSQHAAASDRWAKAADDMAPMAAMLANMQTGLERARDLCASRLSDLKSQKSVLQVKLEALQDSQNAVRSFKRFFGSNPDLEMQELAIEEIERQSTEAEAEIDQFMRVINPVLETADLQKQAEAQRAMDKFESYMSGAKALPAATTPLPTVTTVTSNQPVEVTKR